MSVQTVKKPTTLSLAIKSALAMAAMSKACIAVAESGKSDANRIEEISVYGQQIDIQSSTGSRLNLSIMETPATVDIISGDSIRDRLDFTVLDAVTRSAGFTGEANPGNGGQSIAARGFRGQGAVTKLFDGTSYFNAFGTITFPFDTWGVERIEVLKGPSSVLYGEGGIGGAINVIPKQPQQEHSRHVRVTVGEDDTTFVGIGMTGGLTDELAYRFDYSNSQSDNWVNNGDSETEMLSLALSWQVHDDLSLSLRYDYGDQEPMRYFGIPVVNGDFARQLLDDNFEVGDGDIRYEDESIRLKADWKISDQVAMQAEYYHLESDRFWRTVEFYELLDSGLIRRSSPLIIGHEMEHDGLRVNFSFNNSLAGIGVKSSLGFEVNDISFDRPTNFGPGNPNGVDFDNDFDIVDPNNFNPGLYSDVTSATIAVDDVFSDLRHYTVFGETQLKLTEQLALVLALRYEDAETDYRQVGRLSFEQSADALTGRVGVVYDLNDATVFYAQYGTGATHPGNSLIRASASNRDADFIESEQIEVGIKQQLLDGRLRWTRAGFDSVKNDLTEDDPDSIKPEYVLVFPEQTSQGVELSVNFQVTDALQVYGNGSVLEAEDEAGVTPNYVPEKTANVGVAWWPLERLRLIADGRYVGERFHPSNPIPSYTVVDASAQVTLTEALSLTLKADNVFDERYASAAYSSSTWLVGKPRTFSITADYRF